MFYSGSDNSPEIISCNLPGEVSRRGVAQGHRLSFDRQQAQLVEARRIAPITCSALYQSTTVKELKALKITHFESDIRDCRRIYIISSFRKVANVFPFMKFASKLV